MSADNWIGKGDKLQREKNALDDDFDLNFDDDY